MRGSSYARSRLWAAGALGALVAGGLAIATNVASAQVQQNSLIQGGGGTAQWTAAADAPGDRDGQALQLTVPGPGGYAGIDLLGEPSAPPSAPPSFSFESTVSGSAQASPRLVIAFSDGDYIDMHPATWTANTWTQVNGASTGWDDAGLGGCKLLYSVTYQQALACHQADGSTVSDLYLVSDATYPSGFVNYVDDISYAGTTITDAGQVLANFVPHLTAFPHTVRMTTGSVKGSFSASCHGGPQAVCTVSLKLTTNVGGKAVRIGKVVGKLLGNGTSATVYVVLNHLGSSLLVGHRSLSVTASGSVSTPGNDRVLTRHFRLLAS